MGYRTVVFFAAVVMAATSGAEPLGLGDIVATKGAGCDITSAALAIAQEFSPQAATQRDECLARLDSLARTLDPLVSTQSAPRDKLQAVARHLYGAEHYADSRQLAPTVFVGLHEVVAKQQWNCLGLSVLYVALGERLGLPLRLVIGPGHALVQYRDDSTTFYIETTDGGRIEPSIDYLKSYLPFPLVDVERFKVLEGPAAISALLSQTTVGVYSGGRSPEAIPHFEQAIAIDPGNAEAWTGLGAALNASGRLEDAKAAYTKAIETDPKLVEAYGGLGNMLYEHGELQQAIAVYRKLTEACPREPRGSVNLAKLLFESGDLNAAMGVYERFAEMQAKGE